MPGGSAGTNRLADRFRKKEVSHLDRRVQKSGSGMPARFPVSDEFGVGTIQGVSRRLRVHRRLVREAIQSAVPARRKKTERPHVKMAPAVEFIDAILEADRKAPRKQCGEEDLARLRARDDGSLHRFPFALAVSGRFLHARRRP